MGYIVVWILSGSRVWSDLWPQRVSAVLDGVCSFRSEAVGQIKSIVLCITEVVNLLHKNKITHRTQNRCNTDIDCSFLTDFSSNNFLSREKKQRIAKILSVQIQFCSVAFAHFLNEKSNFIYLRPSGRPNTPDSRHENRQWQRYVPQLKDNLLWICGSRGAEGLWGKPETCDEMCLWRFSPGHIQGFNKGFCEVEVQTQVLLISSVSHTLVTALFSGA